MPVGSIKKEFPIFNNGNKLIYFDNCATTQKPACVIERISRYYSMENSNIHRAAYPLSLKASCLYEAAREKICTWIDASDSREIVFTKGAAESTNLAARALFETLDMRDANIVVTELEHSSNFSPWKHMCDLTGTKLRTAAAGEDGSLDAENVISLIDDRTKILAITAMSNVTGTRPDLGTIINAAHKSGTLVLLDAAQAAAHGRISVKDVDCDLMVFSGHKVYGPRL